MPLSTWTSCLDEWDEFWIWKTCRLCESTTPSTPLTPRVAKKGRCGEYRWGLSKEWKIRNGRGGARIKVSAGVFSACLIHIPLFFWKYMSRWVESKPPTIVTIYDTISTYNICKDKWIKPSDRIYKVLARCVSFLKPDPRIRNEPKPPRKSKVPVSCCQRISK